MAKHAVVKKRKKREYLRWPVKAAMVKIDTLLVELVLGSMSSVWKALRVVPKKHRVNCRVKVAIKNKLLYAATQYSVKYPLKSSLQNYHPGG